ncbi:MAG: DUF5915 domain-containing protein, partial [Myxococcota bacterium]
EVKANFKTLGKRMGKQMKQAAHTISQWGASQLNALRAGKTLQVCGININEDDIVVERHAKPNQAVCAQGQLSVALDTQLDDALRAEGLARETISQLQKLRKQEGLTVADQVHLQLYTASFSLQKALQQHANTIAQEVLAIQLNIHQQQLNTSQKQAVQVDEHTLHVQLHQLDTAYADRSKQKG